MASIPKYRKWKQIDVNNAVLAVQSHQLSINKAADKYGVPRTTLKDKLSGRTPLVSSQGPDPILSRAEESELVEWSLNMSKIGYGRTKEQILVIVQNLLQKHPRPNPFKNNKPGKEWWAAFERRNPRISLRTPEGLGKERAVSTSEEALNKWFRDCKEYLDSDPETANLLEDPSRMYNADESGFPMNPKSDNKVVAEVGSKNVYSLSSDDKTQITVLACANASGYLLPPMFVFPGERFKYNPLFDAVPNSYLGRSKNGWMDHEVFFMWIANHFVKQIPPARPVLLFVDGHTTHIDLEISKFCRENHIILYCLPAHASHIIQPLDVSFFRPLKRNYRKSVKQYKDQNPGQIVTKQIFTKVFRPAWETANRAETFINGFRDAGLYPFNPEAINKEKLAPSVLFHGQVMDDPTTLATSTSSSDIASSLLHNIPSPSLADVPSSVANTPSSTVTDCISSLADCTSSISADIPPLSADSAPIPAKTPEALNSSSTVTVLADVHVTPFTETLALTTGSNAHDPTLTTGSEPLDPTLTTGSNHYDPTLTTGSKHHQFGPSPTNATSTITSSSLQVKGCIKQHNISPIFEGIISYPTVSLKQKRKKLDLPKALTSDQMYKYLEKKKDEKIEQVSIKEEKKVERERKKRLREEAHEKRKLAKFEREQKKNESMCNKCKGKYYKREAHKWVGCECGKWFHLACTDIDLGIDKMTHEQIEKELKEIDWLCEHCLN